MFRHPAGGRIHHRWPSSSSRRSPWRGGSSSPSGLRVCTSSYVFDHSLSLSRVLFMARSWCIASFAIIVGSYDVSPPLLSCNGLSFPFECTSNYVFDLSLSRVLDFARSWCIASFATIVGSYDVSPPLLSCHGLSFPFEVILSDWVFKDLRTLDVCLACAYLWWQWDIHVTYLMFVLVINLRMFLPLYSLVMDWVFPLKLSYRIESLRIWEHLMYVLHVLICGDNGIFTWPTWCLFWWSTCGFHNIVKLCIGVGTRFRLDSPVETLRHSLRFFVLVE